MKIGIFDPYLDDCGGGEKYMMTIAEFLSQNHEVSVFWKNRNDLDLISERFALDLSKVKVEENIFEKKLTQKLKKSKDFETIIVLSDGSIPLILSKKLFLHIQSPIENFGKDLKSKLKLKRVNKVFCNSEYTKKYIDKTSGLNTAVIYPPVDLKPKKIVKENIILTVGRFRVIEKAGGGVNDFKKHNMMVDTFIEMEKDLSKDWRFIIAASVLERDKEEFEKIKEKAKGHNIEFVINKNNDTLWDLYSKAKIYWHASGFGEDLEKHPERAEHFGISTVEAMGGGCVPVVINAGGQKEIVVNRVSGFLWNTEEEFINKTLELIEDHVLFEKLSEQARKSARKFDKNNFCMEIEKLINS